MLFALSFYGGFLAMVLTSYAPDPFWRRVLNSVGGGLLLLSATHLVAIVAATHWR